MNITSCAGIILAGGLNRRMAGQNKALLSIGNQSILGCMAVLFRDLFEQVVLVTNNPMEYLSYDLALVTDLLPIRSSLTGLHSGLFYAQTDRVFCTACDMPFLKKELVQVLLNEADPHWDVIIPRTDEGFQPLCAVYSKRCLKPIEDQLNRGDLKISNFFSRVKVKEIPEADLRAADPELISFFNINTQGDLARFRKWSVHG